MLDHGDVVLDYRCVRPGDIRTEILQGQHAGAAAALDQEIEREPSLEDRAGGPFCAMHGDGADAVPVLRLAEQ